MSRSLQVLAVLLWVAGIVVLVVGIRQLSPDVEGSFFTPESAGAAESGVFSYDASGTIRLLTVGVLLVGVAGALVGGLALRRRRR